MKKFTLALVLMLCWSALTFILWACGDDSLPLSKYENVDVHAYFYYPDGHSSSPGKEVYLGRMRGASACGAAAHSFAHREGMSPSSNWDYICCTIRKGSNCYEKIR